MARTLFILNDPPYGTERSYHALRLAGSLSNREGEELRLFLIGDAASCAKKDQKVPQGYYIAGAKSKELLVRDEDIEVLHGFDTAEQANAYLKSRLFSSDVVGALKPLLDAEPDVRIYTAA